MCWNILSHILVVHIETNAFKSTTFETCILCFEKYSLFFVHLMWTSTLLQAIPKHDRNTHHSSLEEIVKTSHGPHPEKYRKNHISAGAAWEQKLTDKAPQSLQGQSVANRHAAWKCGEWVLTMLFAHWMVTIRLAEEPCNEESPEIMLWSYRLWR